MADGNGTVQIGDKKIKVSDLGDKELRALCRLSKRFFDTKKDMHLEGELLSNIQSVRNQAHSSRTRLLLYPLKSQIYRNETVDPKLGAPREKLQTKLLEEMKKLDKEMAELKKRNLMQRIATVAVVGSTIGGIIGAGLFFGASHLLIAVAALALLAAPIIGFDLYKSLERTDEYFDKEFEKEKCMLVFELLQNRENYEEFCVAKGVLDPDNATFDELIEAYRREPIVQEGA